MQAQAVAVSIGAGGSGGSVTVGGARCEQAQVKQERQGSATVGRGSVVRARLRVAQSRLGSAGHWLVQAVAQAVAQAAQGCGKGDSVKD